MILSVPFCPYHFVRYHFVLEPVVTLVETVIFKNQDYRSQRITIIRPSNIGKQVQ